MCGVKWLFKYKTAVGAAVGQEVGRVFYTLEDRWSIPCSSDLHVEEILSFQIAPNGCAIDDDCA